MATNVDRSLYQMPQGMEQAGAPQDVDVYISGPDDEVLDMMSDETEADFYANLAEEIPDGVLESIASDLQTSIDEDLRAREEWERMYAEGINLLGLKYEKRSDPWAGACGVFHPVITEAVIRFQSDTIMETFPASGPVKVNIVGKVTDEKEKAAKRVEADLNWQVLDNMPEFRPEHERMLWNLPGAGCAFKKVYDCPILGRQTSVFVPAEDVIIPYATADIQTCERVTHRMRKTLLEVDKIQVSGFWRNIDLPEGNVEAVSQIQERKDKETGSTAINDNRPTFYEASVELNLDELLGKERDVPAGLKEGTKPYIITFMHQTKKVVAFRRNWKKEDAKFLKRQHFVQYNYIPGYGAYGFGLFHLLGGFATSATSIMRQLVDAGTLSNLPGGLKSKGLRIKGDDQPVAPGEFRDVDVGSGTIRDNIMPLPYKEPSATLYNLLLNIVEEARRFASTNDIKIGDMSAQAPVGTTLAVLERQLRTMTAIQARVHFSFKQELRLLSDIIRDSKDAVEYDYDVDAPDGSKAKLADYSMVSIIPVSDPNAATMSQRVVQYQAAIQLAQMSPAIYDQPELHRQMLTVLGIKNVGKLVPTDEDIKVVDPVQENQNILKGKPVKAFAWQDHESHIRVHVAAMHDPLIQQLVGQNPKANQIMGAMTSHIAEHVGYAYRNKMATALGLPLPELGKDDSLPQEAELQLSRMLAQVAPQVLQQSQQIVAQQQAQKNAQDPVLVAQQQDQENNKMEIDRKKWKDQQDVRQADAKIAIEAQSKGVDPQKLQMDAAIKQAQVQQQMGLAQSGEQRKEAADIMRMRQAQEASALQMRQSEERAEFERQSGSARLSAEMRQRDEQMKQSRESHQQAQRLKDEKHSSEIAARKKAAAVAAQKPAVKPGATKK